MIEIQREPIDTLHEQGSVRSACQVRTEFDPLQESENPHELAPARRW